MLLKLYHLYLIGLLPTNHIISYNYYNGIPEFGMKRSMLKVK